jgi:uncharacterized protein YndB with AHSA1/START domain
MDVQRSMTFPVSVDELWDAICDETLLEEWFAGTVEADIRPGGTLRVTDGDGVRNAVVETVEPQRRLRFTWTDDPASPASTVELELEPCDDGCELHVRESLPEVADQSDELEVIAIAPALPIGFQPPAPPAAMRAGGTARALARV